MTIQQNITVGSPLDHVASADALKALNGMSKSEAAKAIYAFLCTPPIDATFRELLCDALECWRTYDLGSEGTFLKAEEILDTANRFYSDAEDRYDEAA